MSGLLRRAAAGAAGAAGTAGAGQELRCRLLVVGGGAGGCALAAKFARSLPAGDVVVLEPADTHYYQPMFTLVGGGVKPLGAARRPMERVLPKRARWLKDAAAAFRPEEDLVETTGGRRLRYDFLLVALGIELRFQDVPGLAEALAMPDSGVCSNYSPLHVEKTWKNLQKLCEGNALFTFPNTPVKCPGAPQKIMYLADDYLRQQGKRQAVHISYHTALGVLFGVKHYADALWPLVQERDINVNLGSELVEVHGDRREAVFRDLDAPNEAKAYQTIPFAMLHATPPQGPPTLLRNSTLADPATGFLEVEPTSLRHKHFPNVFGVGDCTNAPTSRTAAGVAAQSGVLRHTLGAALTGRPPPADIAYDGYTSCPLVTRRGRCVLAEFDYTGQPLETFPVDQRCERLSMYLMKTTFMPALYWHLMLRGYWEGPKMFRKLLHFGMSR